MRAKWSRPGDVKAGAYHRDDVGAQQAVRRGCFFAKDDDFTQLLPDLCRRFPGRGPHPPGEPPARGVSSIAAPPARPSPFAGALLHGLAPSRGGTSAAPLRGPPGAAVPLRGGAPSRSHGAGGTFTVPRRGGYLRGPHGAAVPPSRSPRRGGAPSRSHGAGGTAKGTNPPRLFLSVGNCGDTAAPPAPPSGDLHHGPYRPGNIFFREIWRKYATFGGVMSTVPRKGAPPARGTSRPGGEFHRGPPSRGPPFTGWHRRGVEAEGGEAGVHKAFQAGHSGACLRPHSGGKIHRGCL